MFYLYSVWCCSSDTDTVVIDFSCRSNESLGVVGFVCVSVALHRVFELAPCLDDRGRGCLELLRAGGWLIDSMLNANAMK